MSVKELTLKGLIQSIENPILSKVRLAGDLKSTNEDFNSQKSALTNFVEATFNNTNNLNTFLSTGDNKSKLRALIVDATCDTAICQGIVDLYESCNLDIFAIIKAKKTECDGKKIRIGRVGRYTSFATPQLISTLSTMLDITSNLRSARMQPCVIKEPKVVSAVIQTNLAEAVCENNDLKKLICLTINTLDEMEYFLKLSSNKAFLDYLITVKNSVVTSGSIKDVIDKLTDTADITGTTSSKKIIFTNPVVINQMVKSVYNTGIKVFSDLKLECATPYCDVYCYEGVTWIVAFNEDLLPKSGTKNRVLLTKYGQLDTAYGDSVIRELPSDLALLLNGGQNKVAGYRPFFVEEIAQFAGTTTFEALV